MNDEPVELVNPVEQEDDTAYVPEVGDEVKLDGRGGLKKVRLKPAPGYAEVLDGLDVTRNVVVATVFPTMREVLGFAIDNGLWLSSQSGPIHPEDVREAMQAGKKLWQVLGVDGSNPAVLQQMRSGDLSVELVEPVRAMQEILRRVEDAERTVNRINRRLGEKFDS